MININRLIKLKDKYPDFLTNQAALSLFLAKNLPLRIAGITINQPNYCQSTTSIRDELQKINHFFKINFLTINDSNQLREVFEQIPTCLATEYDQNAEVIFDNLLCSPAKNITGTFYTPQTIASLLVKETLAEEPSINFQYLDPACGAGIFLKACLKIFTGNSEKKLTFIENSLFGYDINQQAIEICKFLLLIEALKDHPNLNRKTTLPDLSKNFICQNSLLTEIAQKFDYIFCNPPFGLSRNQQIEQGELEELTRINNWFFTGKLNKYLLFSLRCFQMLKPQGSAGILTPNSWLGIRDGESFRKYLLNEKALPKILCFEKKIFPKLGVETVISIISKKPTSKVIIKKFNPEFELAKSTEIDHHVISNHKNCLIPMIWHENFLNIFNHLQKTTSPLSDSKLNITPSIALQVYSLGRGTPPQSAEIVKNNSFHFKNKHTVTSHPYLNGKDLSSFQINWSGQFLDYGPWVAEFQDFTRYQKPRLLLREVLGKPPYVIKATVTHEIYLYNRSILHIHAQDPKILPLINTIMNSKFASFYLLIKGRKTNRKIFPKIVLDDLKDFPLPNLVDYNSNELNVLLDKPLTSENRSLLDKLVYKQYSLNSEQIKTIEDTLQEWKATF